MSNPSPFRTWLRRRRQERGLTQESLGELVGYSGQTIAKVEGGQRRPSPQLALRLAEVLQLPPGDHGAWMAAALADAEPEAATAAAAAVEAAPPAPEPMRHPAPSRLPAILTPFVGRAPEQAELVALLGRPDCRLVTLLGPGGVGKTRLAVETGRTIQGFADGVAFVSLAPVTATSLIVPAIGDAIGVAFSGMGDLLAQLVSHLREQRLLLILDNLEQLLDPAGATLGLLEQLLAQAPGVSVLATSRERLRLAGEWVLELDGLPVPQPQAQAQPHAAPALRLFAEHAERIDRAFRLTPDNEATIATICRTVDGLPLGIELAAAWTRLLPLDEIALELGRGLDAAHLSPRTLPARHRSLRAVVDYSWQLLNAEEREGLRRLAVFQGGFTREAAAQVAGAGLGVLAGLVDKSLLRRGAGGRYDFHEIIRQHADARLREYPDELAATRGRHAVYYLRLVAERDQRLKGAGQAAATAEIGAEIDNIRAAWPWAAANGLLDELEGAGEVLHWFYEFRSWLQEGAALFAQGLELVRAAGTGGDKARWERALARLLGHYGYLSTRLGAFAQAHAALAESYALLADGRDPLGLSRTLLSQAQLAYWSGDYGRARRLIDQSLDLATVTGDRQNRAMGLTVSSAVAHTFGSHGEAEQLFRAALALWREVGNPRGTVWCITSCTETLLALGKHDEAQGLLRETLALSYAARDAGGTTSTLYNLGQVASRQGDAEEAVYFLQEALPMLRATSDLMYARALNDLGAALRQAGATGKARRAYSEALAISLRLQLDQESLQALVGLATCLAGEGHHAAALRLAARVGADPASKDELRRAAAELRRTARACLPEDEAARIEEQARAMPLTAALAELAPSTGAP
jgi:predicted ATPase/transcriptional regulator with XRE-family HTH domain/Flp pilus assembly protein TadD